MTSTLFSSKDFFQFEKLEHGNYQQWKFDMEDALRLHDFWNMVQPPNGGTTLLKDDDKSYKARSLIRQCCSKEAHAHLVNTKSAKEAWDQLKQIYERNDASTIMSLGTVLSTMYMKEDDNINSWAARIAVAVNRLKAAGGTFTDEQMATVLLRGVTPKHISSRQGIMRDATKNGKQPTWAEALSALKADEIFDELPPDLLPQASKVEQPEYEQKAFSATKADDETYERQVTVERHKYKVCYKCAKPGHLERDCRKWRPGQPWAARTTVDKEQERQDKLKEACDSDHQAHFGATQQSEDTYQNSNDNYIHSCFRAVTTDFDKHNTELVEVSAEESPPAKSLDGCDWSARQDLPVLEV